MPKTNYSKIIATLLTGWLLLAACNMPMETSALPARTPTIELEPTQPKVSMNIIEDTPTPEATYTATPTVPTPTGTSTPTPTQKFVYHEPGEVIAPILLYHHVEGETTLSRYQVSIPDFRAQMAMLDELDFTPIPVSMLVEVLLSGGELPEKPVVITFDDGHMSVYENAFPIMQEYGFPGVFYIVANRINGSPDFVTIPMLKEMVAAGWEIGSHSFSHADLTLNHASASKEIGQSKTDLAQALGIPVETFAYPYGTIDPFIAQKVSDYGYRAGMGLGTSKKHTRNTLFYLSRIEIYGYYTLENFREIMSSE